MEPHYLVDEQGKRIGVFLEPERYEALLKEQRRAEEAIRSLREFRKVLEAARDIEEARELLEDLEDAQAAQETLEAIERGEDEMVDLEEALPRMEAERERLRREGLV